MEIIQNLKLPGALPEKLYNVNLSAENKMPV